MAGMSARYLEDHVCTEENPFPPAHGPLRFPTISTIGTADALYQGGILTATHYAKDCFELIEHTGGHAPPKDAQPLAKAILARLRLLAGEE